MARNYSLLIGPLSTLDLVKRLWMVPIACALSLNYFGTKESQAPHLEIIYIHMNAKGRILGRTS